MYLYNLRYEVPIESFMEDLIIQVIERPYSQLNEFG